MLTQEINQEDWSALPRAHPPTGIRRVQAHRQMQRELVLWVTNGLRQEVKPWFVSNCDNSSDGSKPWPTDLRLQ